MRVERNRAILVLPIAAVLLFSSLGVGLGYSSSATPGGARSPHGALESDPPLLPGPMPVGSPVAGGPQRLSPPGDTEKVRFIESGLPHGMFWNISVNGENEETNFRAADFDLPDGSYLADIPEDNGWEVAGTDPIPVTVPGPMDYTFHFAWHWYAGGVFNGDTSYASDVSMEISVPKITEPKSMAFFDIVSLWDSTGSYDQVGIGWEFGAWQLVYSWTTGLNPRTCTGILAYHDGDIPATPGAKYVFYITVEQGGTVYFTAYLLRGPTDEQAMNFEGPSGVKHLVVDGDYCGEFGYTDYEETYAKTPTQEVRGTDLLFANSYLTRGGTVMVPTWVRMIADNQPDFVTVNFIGPGLANVQIVN